MNCRKYNLWFSVVLCGMTLLIYANAFDAPFHFDDLSFLLENPHIRSFQGLFSDLGTDQRKFLTFATFAVNFKFVPFSPFWYRLVNILMHILTALVTVKALQTLFLAPYFNSQNRRHLSAISWAAALIFCIHPLQTDSVTYIWQRSEILSGLFYAVVLWSYWHGRVEKKFRFIIYAMCLLAIGLYAKGSVMSAPILIGFSEFMFFDGARWVQRHKWKCMLGTAGLIAAAVFLDKILFQVHFSASAKYFFTQCLVIWKYLQLTFFPIGQSVDHGFKWANSLFEPRVFFGFSGLVFLITFISFLARKYRAACFGAIWYFVYLLPTSSVLPLLTPIFEHRLYYSLAGFGLFVAAVVFRIFEQRPKIAWCVLIVMMCILSTLTIKRNQLWQSRTVLMEDAVKKSPDYIRPKFTLGSYYIAEKRLKDAEEMFRQCIQINPEFADAYNNLGTILEARGQKRQAIEYYRKAIQYDPMYHEAYLNISRANFSAGRIDLAWDWIEKILTIQPDHRVYAYAAFLQLKAGNWSVTQQLLDKGFRDFPTSAKLFYVQGLLFMQQENIASAIEALQAAVYYEPKWFPPINDLGVLYFMQKEYGLSQKALERARSLNPRNASVYLNLANVYHELGQFQKAEEYYHISKYQGLLYYVPPNFDGRNLFRSSSQEE